MLFNVTDKKPQFVQRFLSSLRSQKGQMRAAMVLLVFQAGLVFTGSLVRVTGSGLGCVSWPNCHPGSLVPVAGAAPWLHQAIEWGNRLLTFVVAAGAVAFWYAVFAGGRRRELRYHAVFQFVGVVIQALLGAMSVLLKLQWWSVAMHFLPSMILVWAAAVAWVRVQEPDDGHRIAFFPEPLRWLAVGSAASLALVLATGTMVTGAGQHAGDVDVTESSRLAIDLAEIAHVHAHFMYLYLGLTIGLIVALYAVAAIKGSVLGDNPEAARHALRYGCVLIAFIVVQAAIGIIQYRWGVPRWTVPFHVGLSGVVTAYTGFVFAFGRRRVA